MGKNHLMRLNSPNTWAVERKENQFIARPNTTGQKIKYCLPLIIVLRDMLKVGKTAKEIKYILNNNDLLINGEKRKEIKYPLGIFDVIDIKPLKESYRLMLDKKGKLMLVKVNGNEANLILLKLSKKTTIKGGKSQLSFTNGTTMLNEKVSDKQIKINDVIVYDFVNHKAIDVLKLEKGNTIYLTGGQHVGSVVKIEGVKGSQVIFKTTTNETFVTLLDYAFLIGKESPLIKTEDKK
ncbi:hypothetical protein J4434_07640 [Candidatus Woesearchaeota archaeon]|nr:hypothetical protein [Candidatus Woesearchaeota archaeon]